MKLVVAVFALVSFCLAVAQVPKRCATPETWHANLVQVASKNNFYVRGQIYYDRTKQEIVIKEEVAKGETREYYEYYALFKNHTSYQYNPVNGQCNKYAMNETFRQLEVPDSAIFIDRLVIGSNAVAGAGVEVDVWKQITQDGIQVISMWTVEDCVLVSDHAFSQMTGLIVSNFFDIEQGYNPNDLLLPQACR